MTGRAAVKVQPIANEWFANTTKIAGLLVSTGVGMLLGISSATLADNQLELFYSYYTDNSGLDVTSPGFFISKDITEESTLGFMYLYETYEKTAQGNAVDTVSGASTVVGGSSAAFEEDRDEIGTYVTHTLGDTTLGAGYYYGEEPDFESHAVVLAVDQDLFDKNLTLSGRIMFEQDEVDKLDAAATEDFPKDKDVSRLVLAATQLLSPTSLIIGGFALEDQQGFLSSPTRRIVINRPLPGGGGFTKDRDIDEKHPDNRFRQVYFVRGKQYLMSRGSLDLNLSVYTDDWGVGAYSGEFRFSHYLSPQFIARFRYRYYSQSEADFYTDQDFFIAEEEIMSADPRLREFESRLHGFKFTYFPRLASFNDMSVSFAFDDYGESNNGVKADIIQVWTSIPF